MGLGIAALVLTLLGAGFSLVIGAFAIPFPLIGLVLGIVSWVMGTGDLRAIRAGRMDRAGEGSTQGGRVMGMIAVILNIVGLCVCGGLALVAVIFGLAILGAAGGAQGGPGAPPMGPPRRR